MCGICGIYNFRNFKPIRKELLKKMCAVLEHRGPDDEGIFINQQSGFSVGLGHRRLSIIDLSLQGHQPMCNEDESIWIVFNGEIYNFLELRENLIKKGHKFKSKTDTETIIHLYEEKNEKCLDDLRGMFSFAIWDEKDNKLFLARDRIGKKPLFYYLDDEKIIFASEIKSIIQHDTVKREVNLEALDDYLTYLSVSGPKTMFKNIWKLLPGHYMVCSLRGCNIREYWDVSFSNVINKDEDFFKGRLLELLSECVKYRLISDVSLGAFLSGGIDSSVIVALMSEVLKNPVLTSSIGFEEKEFNELDYARVISEKYKTNHSEYMVTPKITNILDKLVWHFDEPFADSSAIPTYYVSKMAKKSVTVALSGDGGDELFAGYRRYYYDRLENRLRIIPEFLRRYLIGSIAGIYPKADRLPQFLRAKTLLTNISLSPERGYYNTRSIFNDSLRRDILNEEVSRELKNYDPFSILEKYFKKANTDDPLSRIQYVDIKTYLVDDILVKVDRMSMAHSLEVRSPLLDHKFLEFAASIPSGYKLRKKKSKYIFKESIKDKLPREIYLRKKMGFSVPLDIWFRNELKEITQELLLDKHSAKHGFFKRDRIENIWMLHQRGKRNLGTNLWGLLMFELWYKKFIVQR